jgi:hypothetical protein
LYSKDADLWIDFMVLIWRNLKIIELDKKKSFLSVCLRSITMTFSLDLKKNQRIKDFQREKGMCLSIFN